LFSTSWRFDGQVLVGRMCMCVTIGEWQRAERAPKLFPCSDGCSLSSYCCEATNRQIYISSGIRSQEPII
jgi:hypothetical protein